MSEPTASANVPVNQRRVTLGRIRSAVGLAGWVKVETFTDPAEGILRYRSWQLQTPQGWRVLRVQNSRWSGQGLQVQFEGIADRDAAELLRNTEVAVFRHEMPSPPAGEYYWDDLLGLTAYTPQGNCLGQLDHFLDSPAHPFMVLHAKDEQQARVEHLVPLVKGRILSVDFAQGRMVLDWTLDWV
ncbi:ribosome maturation factor RimM [Arenimonas sp.]|uniref:ribosome maturation factor RimM n=1 Tax=Arenimonas sp. TaxID=1872635 RepID=UPI0039E391AC